MCDVILNIKSAKHKAHLLVSLTNTYIMEQQFEAVLTGTDTPVTGIVTETGTRIYQFKAIDESMELTIARNAEGNWERVAGSEPYLSGWVDELAEQIPTTL
jgi:hypothetical protein